MNYILWLWIGLCLTTLSLCAFYDAELGLRSKETFRKFLADNGLIKLKSDGKTTEQTVDELFINSLDFGNKVLVTLEFDEKVNNFDGSYSKFMGSGASQGKALRELRINNVERVTKVYMYGKRNKNRAGGYIYIYCFAEFIKSSSKTGTEGKKSSDYTHYNSSKSYGQQYSDNQETNSYRKPPAPIPLKVDKYYYDILGLAVDTSSESVKEQYKYLFDEYSSEKNKDKPDRIRLYKTQIKKRVTSAHQFLQAYLDTGEMGQDIRLPTPYTLEEKQQWAYECLWLVKYPKPSDEYIRKQFRAHSLEYHPDKTAKSEPDCVKLHKSFIFLEINNAYEVFK